MTMFAGTVFAFVLWTAAFAQAATPVELGVKAYNDGDFETAERLLTPYKDQPVFNKILRIIAIQKKKGVNKKQLADIEKMRKGKIRLFDKYGHIAHASGKASTGLSAAMVRNSLATKARAGNADAAFTAGLHSQDGFGRTVNLRDAVSHFSKAAAQGHAEASNSLGFYYRYGIAVKQDEPKAAELFEYAFSKGNISAAYNLALLHFDGINRKRNMMKAYIYADYAAEKTNGNKETRKAYADVSQLRKKIKSNLTGLQRAYLQKYVPYEMRHLFPEDYLEKHTASEFMPELPASGNLIRQTGFMEPVKKESTFHTDILSKDPEEASDKDLDPFFPPVVAYDKQARVNDVFEKNAIKTVAPFPEDADVLQAVYFRPALPRAFHLTLNKEKSGIPLMVGDTLKLKVYTKLSENERSKKSGEKKADNAAYVFSYDKNNVLDIQSPLLFPVSEKTKNDEGFLSVSIRAQRVGTSVLRFEPSDENGFKYTFTVTVHPKPTDDKNSKKK